MSNVAAGVVVVRRPVPARSAVLEASLLASILVCLAGCVTVDATLKADGSGKLQMTYPLSPTGTENLEKRRFTSPHVTVESLKFQADRTAVVSVTFDDATQLSSAEGFSNVTVTRGREGDDEHLTLKLTNAKPVALDDDGRPGPKITLTLPGKVHEANRDAKIEEDRVTWSFSFAAWAKQASIDLTVRYAAPPASDKGGPKDAAAPE